MMKRVVKAPECKHKPMWKTVDGEQRNTCAICGLVLERRPLPDKDGS